MIILIKTESDKHAKKVEMFCNQIAYGQIDPIGTKIENKIKTQPDLTTILHRPNQDVSIKLQNELRTQIQTAWKNWRETWAIPKTETIKITFPDNIKDAWQKGRHYYLFTSANSKNRVIKF